MLVICALQNLPNLLLAVVDHAVDPASYNPELHELTRMYPPVERQVAPDVGRRKSVDSRFSRHPVSELITAYRESEAMPLHEARERVRQLDQEVARRFSLLSYGDSFALRAATDKANSEVKRRDKIERAAAAERERLAKEMAAKARK